MLHPYPTTFSEPVRLLIAYLRKTEEVPAIELVHAAWHVAGYALSNFDPHVAIKACPCPETDEGMAEALESAANPAVGAIPWDLVLAVALELLRRLISQ